MAENDANGHTEAATDLEKKIIKQIEYYFGDKNLPRDRFLRQKIDEDDGWVTLECLGTFNRLKALSEDTDVIAKALRKSDSGLVEVSEDKKKVRRVTTKPLPEDTVEARKEAKNRTLYCKGFPKDASLDRLEEFFDDKGKVTSITMRKDENRLFKGSVFVEFATVDEAKAFLGRESLKYNEEELIKMTKDDYFKAKGKERAQHKEEANKEKEKEEEQKKEEDKEGKEAVEEKPFKFDHGCVLHFKNVGEQTSREDLKSLFGEKEEVAWVDFNRGDNEGLIRFAKEGGAQRAVDALKEANNGKVLIREVESTFRVLEGDEEKDYWVKSKEQQEKGRQKKGKHFRGEQRGRWGRGGGRKRRSFDKPQTKKESDGNEDETKATHTRFDDEEPTPKKIKTEDDS